MGGAFGVGAAEAFIAGSDEETSGLTVLRVAEVCAFQEKLLRAIAACSSKDQAGAADQFGNAYCGEAYSVNPAQILCEPGPDGYYSTGPPQHRGRMHRRTAPFHPPTDPRPSCAAPLATAVGTGLMLRNSNLDGNMKLMIRAEIPKKDRETAVRQATTVMNSFVALTSAAGEYEEFEPADLLRIASLYANSRQQLARFFDLLPADSQSRFFNFAEDVRKYEEEISREGGIERMKL